jgi:hypothetical protein
MLNQQNHIKEIFRDIQYDMLARIEREEWGRKLDQELDRIEDSQDGQVDREAHMYRMDQFLPKHLEVLV